MSANATEIFTLRALLTRLTAKPDKFKLHSFFERCVTRIEDLEGMIEAQDKEIAELRAKLEADAPDQGPQPGPTKLEVIGGVVDPHRAAEVGAI